MWKLFTIQQEVGRYHTSECAHSSQDGASPIKTLLLFIFIGHFQRDPLYKSSINEIEIQHLQRQA